MFRYKLIAILLLASVTIAIAIPIDQVDSIIVAQPVEDIQPESDLETAESYYGRGGYGRGYGGYGGYGGHRGYGGYGGYGGHRGYGGYGGYGGHRGHYYG